MTRLVSRRAGGSPRARSDRQFCCESRRRTSAFTLVELMVVVTIITIFAAMFVPSFSRSLRATSARAATRNVLDVLNYAYTVAVTRGVDVRVNFAARERSFWCDVESTEPDAATQFEPLSLPGGMRLALPDAIRVDCRALAEDHEPNAAADFSVTFRPDGTADESEIALESVSGKRYTVFVSGVTARAWIKEDGDAS